MSWTALSCPFFASSGWPARPGRRRRDRLHPVYKAGINGLFKGFVDILDNDLLIGKPVVLAATAGSSRHPIIVDEHMRPLFAFMRAFTAPTSIFAAPEDWADTTLNARIDRAATELAVMVTSGISITITGNAWSRYQHTFAGNARPDGTDDQRNRPRNGHRLQRACTI